MGLRAPAERARLQARSRTVVEMKMTPLFVRGGVFARNRIVPPWYNAKFSAKPAKIRGISHCTWEVQCKVFRRTALQILKSANSQAAGAKGFTGGLQSHR